MTLYLDLQENIWIHKPASPSPTSNERHIFFCGSITRSAVWQVRAMLDHCAASHSVTVSCWALPPSPPPERQTQEFTFLSAVHHIHPHLFWQSHEFVTHHLLLILYEDDF